MHLFDSSPFCLRRCGVVATGAILFATPVFAGTMQYFDPISATDVNYGHGYNYWHVKAGEQYKAVGEFNIYAGETLEELTLQGTGSGTLIHDPNDPNSVWVMTSAHIVDTASHLTFNLPTSETWENLDGIVYRNTSYDVYTAEEWFVPQSWSGFDEDSGVGNDIAMVKLSSSPVTGSGVTPLHIARDNPSEGTTYDIAGFGLTGDGYSGSVYYTGHRRAGTNTVEYSLASGRILMTDFDAPIGAGYDSLAGEVEDWPVSMEYLIGPGDSGGPDLLGNLVFGVHSFGVGLVDGVADDTFLDYSGSISTAEWWSWIRAVMNGTQAAHPESFARGEFLDAILDDASTVGLQRQAVSDALMEALIEKHSQLVAADDPRATEFASWIDFASLPDPEDPRYEHYQGFLLGLAPGVGTIPEPGSALALAGLGLAGLLRRRR